MSTPGHVDDWRGRARDPPLWHVALPLGRSLGVQLGLTISSALSDSSKSALMSQG